VEKKMTVLSNARKHLRLIFFALFVLVSAGGGAIAAYAHGQQADDCPKGSTDPDCKKK